MLVPSRKIFCAVEAVLFIAYNAKGEPVAASTIAAAQDLPTRYLEPMLQKLVRAGILRGVRGPQGGYVLARERRRITLAEICDVLAAEAVMPAATTALGAEVLNHTLAQLMSSWRMQLASATIETLCEQAIVANVPHHYATPTDFTI